VAGLVARLGAGRPFQLRGADYAAAPRPELLAAIEGTHLSRTSPGEFPGERSDHIYLVDPLGNLMMRFPREPDPSKMLKDLQRLLRYSGVG
jgi:hypothetical protein